jgi:hypothetical protein
MTTEYAEMAEILFEVKEKLDDSEYLALSNLLLKANNAQRKREQINGDAERLGDIIIIAFLEFQIKDLREERDNITKQIRQASKNLGYVICDCGCSLKASSMRTHLLGLKHRKYLAFNLHNSGDAMVQDD